MMMYVCMYVHMYILNMPEITYFWENTMYSIVYYVRTCKVLFVMSILYCCGLPNCRVSSIYPLQKKSEVLMGRWRRTFRKVLDANGDGTADLTEFANFLDPTNEQVKHLGIQCRTYIRMYVRTYVCMYIRTYVCMYVRTYVPCASAVIEIMVNTQTLSDHFCILSDPKRFGSDIWLSTT